MEESLTCWTCPICNSLQNINKDSGEDDSYYIYTQVTLDSDMDVICECCGTKGVIKVTEIRIIEVDEDSFLDDIEALKETIDEKLTKFFNIQYFDISKNHTTILNETIFTEGINILNDIIRAYKPTKIDKVLPEGIQFIELTNGSVTGLELYEENIELDIDRINNPFQEANITLDEFQCWIESIYNMSKQ